MVINYDETKVLNDITNEVYTGKRGKRYSTPISNTIYTFDIEVSSLFKIAGEWRNFDYDLPQEEYRDIEKAAVPYIWMFGIDSQVYYGRELWDFEHVLINLSDENLTKIIWVHSLSYEFAFLLNFLDEKYTIDQMCARTIKKPISFFIKELNIEFRCSYMLTNMSLDKAAKEYTDVKKLTGALDYNKARSPLTKLSELELSYCKMDIITLYNIVKHYREIYKWLHRIPLTSTGIIRKSFRDKMGFFYIKKQQALVPCRKIYLMLWELFAGGYTHANCLHAGKIFHEPIESEDIASSYPAVLVTEKYAFGKFMKCNSKQFFNIKKRNTFCFMLRVHIENIRPKYYNHYLQRSKCHNLKNAILDNGRIYSADSCDMIILDTDYDIIKMSYDCDITITECYKAKKDYLDVEVIKFILHLYGRKTELKGIPEKEFLYKSVYKPQLNSLFGMAVTNQIKGSCDFIDSVWSTQEYSDAFIDEKLEQMKESFSTLWYYAVGCQCTAYARRNLLSVVYSSHEMDRDTIYMDTDSIKFRNREEHQSIFMTYNNAMIEKYRAVCERYSDELELKDFMPSDKDGNLHPIGFYEFDGLYEDTKGDGSFITLGAKKYCYREKGELHITVAGVSKKGVSALKDDMSNFHNGFKWGYKESGKNTHFYAEKHLRDGEIVDDRQQSFDFKDIDGNIYHSDYKWGIILMPTTYTLGVTGEYQSMINMILERERRRK